MKKTLIFVCMFTLSATLFAQNAKTITTPRNQSKVVTPTPEVPLTLKKIFSNLGPKSAAFSSSAWFENGPNSVSGQQFIAMPFKPKSASTVTQVQVAVEYNGSGANQINLSVYSDNAGAPGTLIGGPVTVTNLPTYFSCCALTIGNFSPAVSVLAGTQYWVVADTPLSGLGSDFEGVWAFVPPAKTPVGANTTGTWFSFAAAIQEPAGAVYGTIP
jgi:hypothetical protein